MAFDPIVESIRGALKKLDASPQTVDPYLDLIDAYQNCADKEDEPELLEQAGFVIRDARLLNMNEEQKMRLEELAKRVEATLARIQAEKGSEGSGA